MIPARALAQDESSSFERRCKSLHNCQENMEHDSIPRITITETLIVGQDYEVTTSAHGPQVIRTPPLITISTTKMIPKGGVTL